jgi:hypothetical protein
MNHADRLPGGPLVVQTQGYTPRLWRDRSAIFVANLLAMFFGNEDQTRLLEHEISGADSYGARLVPIMGLLFGGCRNVLVLERRPDAALCAYFGDDLGVCLPDIHVLPHRDYLRLSAALRENGPLPHEATIQSWCEHPADALDAFVTDETIAALARRVGKRTLSTPEGSKAGNNKLLLHQHLEREGLPVFETRIAESPADVPRCLRELARLGFDHAVAKSQIGASGIGLIKMSTHGAGAPVQQLFFHEGPCMVQGWVQKGLHGVTHIHSPSVQMFLDDHSVYLFDLTEQILSHQSVHQGNESPPPYLAEFPGLMEELFRQAGAAGLWLHEQRYRGTASVDFLVAALGEPGAFRVYACEINARVTGATYPSVLARHYLPRGGWLMRNLKLVEPVDGASILRFLEEHGHLFHPHRESGILPINFNLTPDGLVEKGQFLCLGETPAACHEMLLRAEEDLPVDWEYVRD